MVLRLPGSDPSSRPLRSPRVRAGLAGGLLAAAIVVVLVVVLGGSSRHHRAPGPLPPLSARNANFQTIFTEGSAILSNPAGELAVLHALGVDRVRVSFAWEAIAPHGRSRHEPAHFDAADPTAYPAANWAPYDTVVRDARKDHMGLDLVLAPPAPVWASGRGALPAAIEKSYSWDPDAHEFQQFVEAVGTRYSGHYTPTGAHSPLPREGFWSIWNEPNVGVMLSPQTIHGPTVEVSPVHYRALADAAWTALQRTGHGHDTTLIGELGPAGSTNAGAPGDFAVMAPLRFLRVLYCVGPDYRPLRGSAATARGCPTTTAGTRHFAAADPVLFKATDYADHPYPYGLPPDKVAPDEPDYAELAELPKLFSTLDRLQLVYGSHRRFDVYSTEFGYQTSPPDQPDQAGAVSPAEAARWLNWSEYLTWRMPRVLSYDQYLLFDPPPLAHGHKPYAAFASGLGTYTGALKPGFAAFRMPIWLPQSTARRGGALEVWGCVRPAKIVSMARRAPAQIQFQGRHGNSWRTIATVSTRTRYGYFDVREHFPASGSVRIRWTPPTGAAIESRTATITVG
jgi:hypothetical protein